MKSLVCLTPLALTILLTAPSAMGQTFTWDGAATPLPTAPWSTGGNWQPSGPPPVGGSVVIDGTGKPFGYGPRLDVDINLANLTISNGGALWVVESDFTPTYSRHVTVTGNTTLSSAPGQQAGSVNAAEGCTFTLGTLLNQSSATLLRGAQISVGNNVFRGPGPAIVEWRGANIVRNEAIVSLHPNGVLRAQDTHLDALRGFSQNAGTFGIDGVTFVTPGAFTNFGLIQVNPQSNNPPLTRMEIGGNFVNFDAGSGVLNGGTLWLQGRYGARAEFAFPGADIRTLAPFTSIMMEGDAAILDSITGENGLRHLGQLSGNFSVATALGIEPANGVLQHVGGNLNVLTNGFLTVTGDYNLSNGGTITISGPGAESSTRMTVNGRLSVDSTSGLDLGGQPGVNTIYSTELEVRDGIDFRGASLTGSGTTYADIGIIGSTVSPGHSAGLLSFVGALTLDSGTVLKMEIGGTDPGVGHDQIVQSGPMPVTVDGQLRVSFINGFQNSISWMDRFELIVSDQPLLGGFSNVADGGRVATTDGHGSFRVSWLSGEDGNKIVLTDYVSFDTGTNNVFIAQSPVNAMAWEQSLNWSLGVPGPTRPDVVIPYGSYSTSSTSFPALQTLALQPGSSHTLHDATTLEFLDGVTLEGHSGASSYLLHSGTGNGLLVTNRITGIAHIPNENSSSAIDPGVHIIQPGNAPAPLNISRAPGGVLYIGGSITPFRGSTLTFDAQANGVTGSNLQILGNVGEAEPGTPSPNGAAVVVNGGGATLMIGANTYTGGTTVQNSIRRYDGGGFGFGGGLYADNLTGSATGPGAVMVTSTAGTDADTDNRGSLSGNGHIAGDVTIAGGYFQPGNSLFGNAPTTITLGGDLTMTQGPRFGGTQPADLLIDLDPRNADPAQRRDLILLSAPAAQVQLTNVGLTLELKSPPTPGEVFRVIEAPGAGGAITGTFNGLPSGSTVSSVYFGVPFTFTLTYGSNFVELTHVTPPAMSYAYQRTFYFTAFELYDEALTGPAGDSNSDSIANLMAYALGTDPKQFPSGRLPQASKRDVSGQPYLVIEIRRALPLRPDLTYFVGESGDLDSFGTPIDIDDPANAARVVSRTNQGDGSEIIVVRASAPIASPASRQFLRFSVELPE